MKIHTNKRLDHGDSQRPADPPRIVLITGASSGVGAATAAHLAKGNEILIHYYGSRDGAHRTAERVAQAGGKSRQYQANLGQAAECVRLMQEVTADVPRLDVLINNAGAVSSQAPIGSFLWDDIEREFALNAFGPLFLTSLLVPLLRQGFNPCIVNVTSRAIRYGGTGSTLYAASKGAVDVFTRGAANELAPDIRVNAIAPGVIDTPFHNPKTAESTLRRFASVSPLGMHGRPEHIAQTIAFLVYNEFITGETVDVNGGAHMR